LLWFAIMSFLHHWGELALVFFNDTEKAQLTHNASQFM